jgi:hypothetical protein
MAGLQNPRHVAHKTVRGQVAALVELRDTHWHTTAHGGLTIEGIAWAQVQTLATCAHPRQHLRALLSHQHGVTVSQGDAVRGQTLKNF